MKQDELVTAGEFARLSQSTKRTVIWYSQNGLLRPVKVNSQGYRFYKPEQIIDFQVIMLLRRLNFSLAEIKKFLRVKSPKELFKDKEKVVKDEMLRLQTISKNITNYYSNLEKFGVLVEPKFKVIKSFNIYYIDRVGAYSQIYDYGLELKSYFSKIPKNTAYLTIFSSNEYLPKKDNLRVGVVVNKGMKLKKQAKEIVKRWTVPRFKSLSYTHIGSPALISMMWKQMRDYKDKYKLKRDYSYPFFELEFYIKTGLNDFHDEERMISELNMPMV
ncbi:MerR family transcriptional regulator [Candidatus Daviesbacteria bacterium]|nr:MerR family transcriptional regulator [Candidatus Daviesbacteria bacterium]